MVAAALLSAGYRTGLYTSPYLENFRERIQIDGKPIDPALLVLLTEQVKKAIDALTAEGMEQPGEFEIITAIGFCAFSLEKCDIVVLETGLGGRFDATNVIAPPIAAAITSISLDHTRVLGDTVSAIAREKCGILKSGSCAVVSIDQNPEVLRVIQLDCAEKGIQLTQPETKELSVLKAGPEGTNIRYRDQEVHIPLMGEHQINNVLTALEILRCLRQAGYPVSEAAAVKGIGGVQWPGRLELFPGSPRILLDSAHNPGGAAALCRALDSCFPGVRPVTVMGMFADKDYANSISLIAGRSSHFIAVAPAGSRALSASECMATAAPFCPNTEVSENLDLAIARGRTLAGRGGLLLICGSISLVGRARTYLSG